MCLGSEGCIVLRAHGTIRERGHGRIARFGYGEWKQDHANAEFAATITPDLAVMLADWLQVKAANPGDHDYGYALAVAEAGTEPGRQVMIKPEIRKGTQVRILKWDGQFNGTVTRRKGDDVYVTVHGHLASEQLDVAHMEALHEEVRAHG